MTTDIPTLGTRYGALTREQQEALPVGTVLGPSQHDGSTRLVLTEKVTVRRVWMDDDGHPVTFPLSSRIIVSYPPDGDGTSTMDARSLALEEVAVMLNEQAEREAALAKKNLDVPAAVALREMARRLRKLATEKP